MATDGYNIPDYGGYERQRGDVNYKYTTDSATNAYGRFLGQQRYERQSGDAMRNYGRAYPGYKAQFGQRGFGTGGINSGAMQRSMNNFVGDFQRDYTRAAQDQTVANQHFDLQQVNLDQYRQQALQDIETQKANDIANAALNLQYWKTAMGGI
jgi:hypothetical protein